MTQDNNTHGQEAYLGDGVYASFDGWQVWLAANHNLNRVVALEPQVMLNAIRYAERIWGPQSEWPGNK